MAGQILPAAHAIAAPVSTMYPEGKRLLLRNKVRNGRHLVTDGKHD